MRKPNKVQAALREIPRRRLEVQSPAGHDSTISIHSSTSILDAMLTVIRNQARRIDLAVTIDGGEYKVVMYRQLDDVVRCEFKRITN
jgi:hypothetical protein